MPNIDLAKDRLLDVEARINQKSVPVIITVKNRVDGVDTNRDITGDNLILEVYKSPFLERTTSYVFRLAVGSGLTIQGVDNHQLKVEVTAAQATQWPDIYTWLLVSLTEGFAWLSGEWEFFSGSRDNPATDNAEIVISDEGDEIIIIIDNGGGSGVDLTGVPIKQGNWTNNAFPTTQGILETGDPIKDQNYWIIGGLGVTIDGVYLPPSTMLFANQDAPTYDYLLTGFFYK